MKKSKKRTKTGEQEGRNGKEKVKSGWRGTEKDEKGANFCRFCPCI
jgi:hypothetical protein